MSDFEKLKQDVERLRDEIKLNLHLASLDAKDEWQRTGQRWDKFVSEAELDKSASGIGGKLAELGGEFKLAFQRMLTAMKD